METLPSAAERQQLVSFFLEIAAGQTADVAAQFLEVLPCRPLALDRSCVAVILERWFLVIECFFIPFSSCFKCIELRLSRIAVWAGPILNFRVAMWWYCNSESLIADVFYRLQVGSLMRLYSSSTTAMKVVGWSHLSYLDRLMELLGGLRLKLDCVFVGYSFRWLCSYVFFFLKFLFLQWGKYYCQW